MAAAKTPIRGGKAPKNRSAKNGGFCRAENAPLPAWGETLWKKIAVYGALIAAPGTVLFLVGLVWYLDSTLQNMKDMDAAPPAENAQLTDTAYTDGARHAAAAGSKLSFKQIAPQAVHKVKAFSADLQSMHKGLFYTSIAALAASLSSVLLLFYFIWRDKRHRRKYQSLLVRADSTVENRVRHRTARLEAARCLAEKERRRAELLLQDTSHRVGNSLAGVSSMLGLQLSRAHDEEARRALLSARDRVLAVSSAHRRLRLNKDMETACAGEFLTAVIHDVENGLTKTQRSHINIETHFEPWLLPARDVTTLGIILSELLINAVKHAFPSGRRGRITVSFGKMRGKYLRLIVEDNGIGFPGGYSGGAPAQRNQGLGRLILAQLATQFDSVPHYASGQNGGSRITIPLLNVKNAVKAEKERDTKKAAA